MIRDVDIAYLPAGQMGRTPAVVATQMKLGFPLIRFSLMVRTGGGAPSNEAGTRLGYIVIKLVE